MPTDEQFREAAILEYADDDLEIDQDAVISRGDEGAFVAAWVWVPNTYFTEEDDDA